MVDGQWSGSRLPSKSRLAEHPLRVFSPLGSLSVGGRFLDTYVASASFTNDFVLLGMDLKKIILLVDVHHSWCSLLGITLNLTQHWSQAHPWECVVLPLATGPLELEARATFRVVGVELGSVERISTSGHIAQRVYKALLSGRRLAGLVVPTPLAAHLWRSTILP